MSTVRWTRTDPCDGAHEIHRQDRRYTEILAALSPLDDGTGTLGTIVRTAVADDPAATVEDVRSIVEQAIAEAAAEAAVEVAS